MNSINFVEANKSFAESNVNDFKRDQEFLLKVKPVLTHFTICQSILLLFTLIIGSVLLLPLPSYVHLSVGIFVGIPVGLSFLYFTDYHKNLRFSEYTITNNFVEERTGLINKTTLRIQHADIRDVSSKQSFWQKLLGTSNIEVSNSNGRLIILQNVENGDFIKEEIWRLKQSI